MKKSLGAKTLAIPTPVWVVGAYDAAGKANGATIAWGGICCSKPPCLAISLRSATYTHGCVMATKAFTVSIPAQDQAAIADYFGIASGRDGDKFAACGLTAAKAATVNAPYIEEFPLVLECELINVLELGLHTQFVGEIKDVRADETVLAQGEKIDIEKLGTVLYATGSRAYYGLGPELGPAFNIGNKFSK